MESGPGTVLLDASCLLNLYATERFGVIASSLREHVAVADYVVDQEALYVRRRPSADAPEEQAPVDLSPLVPDGVVEVMRLERPEEEATFVSLAALMDDGEAVTGALALHRGCSVATDDRKARRVLGQRAPTVPLVSTLDLLSQWAEATSIPAPELRTAMECMRSGASYVPGPRDPRFEWWREVVQG